MRFLQRLNSTHLYACGTYAFHPLCAAIDANRFTLPSHFEEGKEKCPYDPARGYTGLIVDGGLYTATRYEFRSLPDIRRNLHQRPLKTEESPLHWLNDAEFVASVLVRESKDSPVGDDDKIYYFFTEWAGEETTSFFDKSQVARVARVARVCKSDVGGKKILLHPLLRGAAQRLQPGWRQLGQHCLLCRLHALSTVEDHGGLSRVPLQHLGGAACLRGPLHGVPGLSSQVVPL